MVNFCATKDGAYRGNGVVTGYQTALWVKMNQTVPVLITRCNAKVAVVLMSRKFAMELFIVQTEATNTTAVRFLYDLFQVKYNNNSNKCNMLIVTNLFFEHNKSES